MFRREGGRFMFLLLMYFGDYYDFTKGNQEADESEVDTVKREVEEETGLKDITFIEGFQETVTYYYQRENEIVHKKVSYYLVETATAEIRISYEHKAYEWLPFDEAIEALKFANSRQVLKKARDFLEGSLLRFQE